MLRQTTVELSDPIYNLVQHAAKKRNCSPILVVRRAIVLYLHMKDVLDKYPGSSIVIIGDKGQKIKDMTLP